MESANNKRFDRIRGSLIGGAAGDALGYAVEFMRESSIYARYGTGGIQAYELDPVSKKAIVSDDTQMTLFTAAGLLRYIGHAAFDTTTTGTPDVYIRAAYQDWLRTQETSFAQEKSRREEVGEFAVWLCDVPELFHPRAPGNTCLAALRMQRDRKTKGSIDRPINNSKGCGGVMRVAPMGLTAYGVTDPAQIDREGAEAAAITHGHPLGYLPAAVLTHILSGILSAGEGASLRTITLDAIESVSRSFAAYAHADTLRDLLLRAVELSENTDSDLNNIHALGEGWVGEEALAIAVYCTLRYESDFSACIIAAVNHKGDSDSTGAVAGNILGAWVGLGGIDPKWVADLEMADVICTVADDLCAGESVLKNGCNRDSDWYRRNVLCRR